MSVSACVRARVQAAIFESFTSAYDQTEDLYKEAEDLFVALDLNADGKICRVYPAAVSPPVAPPRVHPPCNRLGSQPRALCGPLLPDC